MTSRCYSDLECQKAVDYVLFVLLLLLGYWFTQAHRRVVGMLRFMSLT